MSKWTAKERSGCNGISSDIFCDGNFICVCETSQAIFIVKLLTFAEATHIDLLDTYYLDRKAVPRHDYQGVHDLLALWPDKPEKEIPRTNIGGRNQAAIDMLGRWSAEAEEKERLLNERLDRIEKQQDDLAARDTELANKLNWLKQRLDNHNLH
jgi:hypothetical protein